MSGFTSGKFFGKVTRLWFNPQTVFILYILFALISSLKQNLTGSYNNYLIFKYVFWHTIEFKPLYTENPSQYFDSNHYGPFFSVIIAPFALLPDPIGTFLWNIANTLILILGINKLTFNSRTKAIIAWICAHELLTSLFSFQFNVAITGLILLSFAYLEKRKEFLSALAIAIGFFVKLYGIVGLAFFFFSKNRFKFIYSVIICFVVCFVLPMLLSSPQYILNAYSDWFHSLLLKNELNKTSEYADISLFGFLDRALHIKLNILVGLAFGASVLLIALMRFKQHQFVAYRYMILAYLLLCLVMINTNVESPTYIIGFFGVAIWYIIVPRSGYTIALLVFALILTSLSPSDLFPKFIRTNYVRPYALKALPCILIWIDIICRILFADFKNWAHTAFNKTGHQTLYVGK